MFTSEKIDEILSTYIKKQHNRNVFTKYILQNDNIQNLLYEIIIDFEDDIKLTDILSKIKNNKYCWNQQNFEEIKYKIKEHDNFVICPFEVAEGVLECNKCGSKKTFSYSKQTRSGDESTTVFATCVMCKSSWKI